VHPDRPYVQFQWLWELLAYASYALAGLLGVRLFQVAVLTASFALLAVLATRQFRSRALTFAFCALALVLFEDRFQARPAATVLGFVVLILPWLLDAEARERRWVWLQAIAVGCLWSNIHGGEALLMPLCFAALALGGFFDWRRGVAAAHEARASLKLLLAACAGVALSPTFLPGMIDWAHAIGPQLASGNKEWRPSYTMLENGLAPNFVLIGLGPSLVLFAYAGEQIYRWRSSRLRAHALTSEWLLCGGLLALAHQAVRNAFLCLIPLAFSLRRWSVPSPSPRARALAAAGGASLLMVAFYDHVIVGYGGVASAVDVLPEDVAPNAFPEELAQFMREAGIRGGVLNDGRWGGYLIWRLWPLCHVFVDSRHDLSREMWPVFLASQHAHTRPAAMDYAFRRWGVELAVFRGPTFPLVVAPPEWRLVFKAGDQELYQHVAGANAAGNLERTRNWLRARRPLSADTDLAQLAREVGAAMWLAAPYRLHQQATARALAQSGKRSDVLQGLSIESQLLFAAGRYGAAQRVLDQLLALDPQDAKALYRAALTAFALDDRERARRAVGALRSHGSELSSAQLGRLLALQAALAR
ncbi:MAG TPA: tetratricopeptide repeat protein, partial [Polyangiaceae bacterium]|nr:tetratricopeptide repeat protein [Polyangiaceae bacterium]